MSDEPGNQDDGPFERRYPDRHERDPELERKVQAVLAKRKPTTPEPMDGSPEAGDGANVEVVPAPR